MSDDWQEISSTVWSLLMTEEAIYGLILISGMIVVAGVESGLAGHVLITVIVTTSIFYIAHVYAGVLAHLAQARGGGTVGAALRASLHDSFGLLASSVVPIVILSLGRIGVIDDDTAIWAALVVNTVMLGAFGWIAVARWNAHWSARIFGCLLTASFGFALIVLKALVSH